MDWQSIALIALGCICGGWIVGRAIQSIILLWKIRRTEKENGKQSRN